MILFHDRQHFVASGAGAILGLGIFVLYYFFSRIENFDEKSQPHHHKEKEEFQMYRWD